MLSNRGQALLEFVLVMPIFLMLLLAIIDFGRIIYEKNRLENISNDVIDLINADKSLDYIKSEIQSNYNLKINISAEEHGDSTIVKLSRKIDVITPGLGIAIEDPYPIEVSRVIFNE